MNPRRNMQPGDFSNVAFNLVIGALLGSAAHGLLQLVTTAFWPVAVFIVIAFSGVFVLDVIVGKLFDLIIPSGIRPPSKPYDKERKPLPRLLSFPVGILIGVGLAMMGLDRLILDMLP